jgi:hypothetical protein
MGVASHEKRAFNDVMWKNTVVPDRPHMTIYRVSIKSFLDYKHLLQENYVEYKHIFFSKCNSTQEVYLQLT